MVVAALGVLGRRGLDLASSHVLAPNFKIAGVHRVQRDPGPITGRTSIKKIPEFGGRKNSENPRSTFFRSLGFTPPP